MLTTVLIVSANYYISGYMHAEDWWMVGTGISFKLPTGASQM